MTQRERLQAVMRGEIPDCVPVCPDISNMVPARLTGKPFWDIYLYQDPPLWKAYIDAVKYFDIDGGFELYEFGDLFGDLEETWIPYLVLKEEDRLVTQDFCPETESWSPYITVHTRDNPPATNVSPDKVGLPPVPTEWEPLEGVKEWPQGLELWQMIRKEMGSSGIVGMPSGMSTLLLEQPDDIYAYYDNPQQYHDKRDRMIAFVHQRLQRIAQLEDKPDFLFCGASGSLVFQSPDLFRELALPVLKYTTERAYDMGIPTHVHSCGPETQLVKMAAEETQLTVIDPLEIAPMGDCDLKDLKQRYGDRIVLKGNLHTTQVMLQGTPDQVIAASQAAIDAAAAGGRFILSTGDQCGRDTPDENIRAMVETARTYGRY